MEKNRLRDYIRERRVSLGLSQEAPANLIGITSSQAEISRLERGPLMMPGRAEEEQALRTPEPSPGDDSAPTPDQA
jgi:transcriptional regulator with XRE-family HTH domain